MMWIVKIALRAPYTFTVLGVLLLIGGALSMLQMAKDIFPAINIPVVGIIWTYNQKFSADQTLGIAWSRIRLRLCMKG